MDTVVITSADAFPGVLGPTLADAIAAAQFFANQCLTAATAVASNAANAQVYATDANEAAVAALSAASLAANTAAATVLPSIATGSPVVVPKAKFLRALNGAGVLQNVLDYIQNNTLINSDIAIELVYGSWVQSGGVLWTATKTALSYTSTQMATLMTNSSNLGN